MLIVKGNRSHNTAAFTTPYNFCQKKCCHSNLADKISRMLYAYSPSIDNPKKGGNLQHKLLLEKRLIIEEIN